VAIVTGPAPQAQALSLTVIGELRLSGLAGHGHAVTNGHGEHFCSGWTCRAASLSPAEGVIRARYDAFDRIQFGRGPWCACCMVPWAVVWSWRPRHFGEQRYFGLPEGTLAYFAAGSVA
jgi:hypothetical protein